MRLLSAMLCLAATLCGQVVRLENVGPTPWAGWHRVTVDQLPPKPIGWHLLPVATPIAGGGTQTYTEALYVLGRQTGLSTWAVDIKTALLPGQRKAFDLASFTPCEMPRPWLPADPYAFFGGMPTCNGIELSLARVLEGGPYSLADGAAIHVQFSGRVAPMWVVDVWLRWYDTTPGYCTGEAQVTCSNPAVPHLDAVMPPSGLNLTFGDGLVIPLGGALGQLVAPGVRFADGQSRIVPIVVAWSRHQPHQDSVLSEAYAAIMGCGISRLLPDGNPRYAPSLNPWTWAGARWVESIRRLHTWDAGLVGPNRISGDTGAQEDQVFVRGEALLPGGTAAAQIAYWAALKLANRPCHHREPNGTWLDPGAHTNPRLLFWDGRPHWSASVSPDRLGKVGGLVPETANGWWGPDVEHWLVNTLAAGARIKDSPALQGILRAHASIYRLQQTTTPGWATSSPFASRAVGWEGIAAVHLWTTLEDRALAAVVRTHWQTRWSAVINPAYGVSEIVDIRVDDPRLGPGPWWMPWQQSVAAYGLDLAGVQFATPAARTTALRLAKKVLADGWALVGTRWATAPIRPVVATGLSDAGPDDETIAHARAELHKETGVPEPEAAPALFDESFNLFGMPLAVAVVLRHEPNHVQARAIWTQITADANVSGATSWLAPGL